jgi:hypothetical protein
MGHHKALSCGLTSEQPDFASEASPLIDLFGLFC